MATNASSVQSVSDAAYTTEAGIDEYAADRYHHFKGQSVSEDRLTGFCMLINRKLINAIGGLDPRFGIGNFDDDDYCLRARLAGWDVRIALGAFVHHIGHATFAKTLTDDQFKALLLANWELFKTKWNIPMETPYGGTRIVNPTGVDLYVPLSTPDD
jgi:O-antigen biosynthesis protein